MSWSVERLDALPEGTVISWGTEGWATFTKETAGRPESPWAYSRGGRESSGSLLIISEEMDWGLHVVSIPVDALLSDETVRASAQYPHSQASRDIASCTLRDAVAHITGEAL